MSYAALRARASASRMPCASADITASRTPFCINVSGRRERGRERKREVYAVVERLFGRRSMLKDHWVMRKVTQGRRRDDAGMTQG